MWYDRCMKKHPTHNVFFTENGEAYNRFGKKLTPQKTGLKGYERYYLEVSENYKTTNKSLARWLAETFIENPHNLEDVDHIDGDPSNDVVSNLQWLSHQKNVEKSHAKVWLVEDIHFGLTIEVYNLKKWCRDMSVRYAALLATSPHTECKDKRNHSGGYRILNSYDA